MSTYANQKRTEIDFKVGEQVLLSSQHLTPDNQANRQSKKLQPLFLGPFKILEKIGKVAYKLQLPDTMRLHPVFHVSRLRPYHDPSSFTQERKAPPPPPPIKIEDVVEYEVEKILDKRIKRNRIEYLVQWKGYPPEDNSWEPIRNLSNSPATIQDYETQVSSSQGDMLWASRPNTGSKNRTAKPPH